jgi:Concanavalin A-like lectin/glucanases superfamily
MSYSSEVLARTPAAYYRMNESSGVLQDASGNSLTGNVWASSGSGPTYQVAGPITTDPTDHAIDLTVNARTSIPDNALLDFGDVCTMAMWVRRNSTISTTQMLLSKGTNAYSLLFNSDNTVAFNKAGVSTLCSSTITITDALWHFLVGTKNGSTVKIYIDAVDVTGTVTNATLTNTATALEIGQETGGFLYHGVMDELAVFPTELIQSDVQTIFQAASPFPTLGILPEFPAEKFGPF